MTINDNVPGGAHELFIPRYKSTTIEMISINGRFELWSAFAGLDLEFVNQSFVFIDIALQVTPVLTAGPTASEPLVLFVDHNVVLEIGGRLKCLSTSGPLAEESFVASVNQRVFPHIVGQFARVVTSGPIAGQPHRRVFAQSVSPPSAVVPKLSATALDSALESERVVNHQLMPR